MPGRLGGRMAGREAAGRARPAPVTCESRMSTHARPETAEKNSRAGLPCLPPPETGRMSRRPRTRPSQGPALAPAPPVWGGWRGRTVRLPWPGGGCARSGWQGGKRDAARHRERVPSARPPRHTLPPKKPTALSLKKMSPPPPPLNTSSPAAPNTSSPASGARSTAPGPARTRTRWRQGP